MTVSASIYYFSGTGNTGLVARLLERELKQRSVSASLQRIEDVVNGKLAVRKAQVTDIASGQSLMHEA